jgi:hypothetical protein
VCPGRKIRSADEARAALEAVDRWGGDRAAWARANDINPRSLNAWRLNLQRGQRSTPRLVELVAATTYRPSNAGCRVLHGDFVVEVDANVDEDALVRVLRAVRAC